MPSSSSLGKLLVFSFVTLLGFAILSSQPILTTLAEANSHAADRFAYLDLFTNEDLQKYLQDHRVVTTGGERRSELLRMAVAIEAKKEQQAGHHNAASAEATDAGHDEDIPWIVEIQYCHKSGDQFESIAAEIRDKLRRKLVAATPTASLSSAPKASGNTVNVIVTDHVASLPLRIIGTISSFGTFLGLALVAVSKFALAGMPQHQHLSRVVNENRVPIVLAGYAVSAIGSPIGATGAFDIYLYKEAKRVGKGKGGAASINKAQSNNKSVLFSATATGSLPTDVPVLVDSIVSRIRNGGADM